LTDKDKEKEKEKDKELPVDLSPYDSDATDIQSFISICTRRSIDIELHLESSASDFTHSFTNACELLLLLLLIWSVSPSERFRIDRDGDRVALQAGSIQDLVSFCLFFSDKDGRENLDLRALLFGYDEYCTGEEMLTCLKEAYVSHRQHSLSLSLSFNRNDTHRTSSLIIDRSVQI